MLRKLLTTLLTCTLLASLIVPAKVGYAASKAPAPPVTWHKMTRNSEANNLYDIVSNNRSVYVAVGDEGTVLRSEDATNWEDIPMNTVAAFNHVVTNGDQFVVVGQEGQLRVSDNGRNWNTIQLNLPYTYGDLTATDEKKKLEKDYTINWNTKVRQTEFDITSAVWDGKRFVALAEWRTKTGALKSTSYYDQAELSKAFYLTSEDGTKWTVKIGSVYGTKLIYTGTHYAALGKFTISTSKDLVTWTTSKPPGRNFSLNDVMYANGKYFALGYVGEVRNGDGSKPIRSGFIYASTDGMNWKMIKNKTNIGTGLFKDSEYYSGFSDLGFYSILWDGTQYWITGYKGLLMKSKDGLEWELKSDYWDVSIQPFLWSNVSGNEANMNKLFYDGKQYIMVGNKGTIITSNDLKKATIVRQRTSTDFRKITTDNKNRYIASGFKGTVWESENGFDWNPSVLEKRRLQGEWDTSTEEYVWDGIAIKDGVVLLAGRETTGDMWGTKDANYFYSPTPGIWKRMEFPEKLSIVIAVTVLNNNFVVISPQGVITSKDGITWSPLTAVKKKPEISQIVSNGKILLGVGSDGSQYSREIVYSSPDGVKWTPVTVKWNNKPHYLHASLTWDGERFIDLEAKVINFNNPHEVETKVQASSTDGVNWKLTAIKPMSTNKAPEYFPVNGRKTNHEMKSIVWDGKKLIAVGENGVIMTSVTRPAGTSEPAWPEEKTDYYISDSNIDDLSPK